MDQSERIFMAKEPADGLRLAGVIAAKPLAVDVALKYAVAISAILSRAHKMGSIHGRLCPSAILLSAAGAALLDPPAVSASDAAPYRSPEQVRGEPASERSDVFSFGALLFHMIAGVPPFSTAADDSNRAILEDPPAWDAAGDRMTDALRRLLEDCLEKSELCRRQRVQNVAAELRFIEIQLRRSIMDHKTILREPAISSTAARRARRPRLNPQLLVIAISVMALASVAVGAALWLAFR